MNQQVNLAATQAAQNPPREDEIEGEGWTFRDGRVSQGERHPGIGPNGIEGLSYNNPFGQGMERVWYDGKIVFALDTGELEIDDPSGLKVAREYQCVYSVELDEHGRLANKEEVPRQLNIYDSVPGMEEYSPIWQFYYVLVPRDYTPNTLRSARDCEGSGYRVRKSNVFEN